MVSHIRVIAVWTTNADFEDMPFTTMTSPIADTTSWGGSNWERVNDAMNSPQELLESSSVIRFTANGAILSQTVDLPHAGPYYIMMTYKSPAAIMVREGTTQIRNLPASTIARSIVANITANSDPFNLQLVGNMGTVIDNVGIADYGGNRVCTVP